MPPKCENIMNDTKYEVLYFGNTCCVGHRECRVPTQGLHVLGRKSVCGDVGDVSCPAYERRRCWSRGTTIIYHFRNRGEHVCFGTPAELSKVGVKIYLSTSIFAEARRWVRPMPAVCVVLLSSWCVDDLLQLATCVPLRAGRAWCVAYCNACIGPV